VNRGQHVIGQRLPDERFELVLDYVLCDVNNVATNAVRKLFLVLRKFCAFLLETS